MEELNKKSIAETPKEISSTLKKSLKMFLKEALNDFLIEFPVEFPLSNETLFYREKCAKISEFPDF